MLVIITGDVDGVAAPATVRFLVPSAAEMYSAGSIDDVGVYSGGPPDRESSSLEGWDEISYEITSDTFRVEYYAPIIIGETDKTISYEFYSLYPISDLTVYLQEPLSSSNYSVSPSSNDVFKTEDPFSEVEFKFHRYYYSGLDADDPLSFKITYTKLDPDDSMTIADKGSGINMYLIVGVSLGACVLIAAGIYFAFRIRSGRRIKQKYNDRNAQIRKAEDKSLRGRYCSKCGHRLNDADRFCPNCGVKRD